MDLPFLTAPDASSNELAQDALAGLTSSQTLNPPRSTRQERASYMKRLDACVAFYVLIDLGDLLTPGAFAASSHAGACLRAAILPSDWKASAQRQPSCKEGDAFNRAFICAVKDLGQHDILGEISQYKFSMAFLKISDRIEQALSVQKVADCAWVKSVAWSNTPQHEPDSNGGVFFEFALQSKHVALSAAAKMGRLDEEGLDEALGRSRLALDTQFQGRALFERCRKLSLPAFETPALLAAAHARELRDMLSSDPKHSPRSVRL